MPIKKLTSKKMKPSPSAIKKMADSVGEFISYWGFRRIHGQLWSHIYLSQTPLSGADLVRALNVSKALVSPALAELIHFDLIRAENTDGRTKKYTANPEVFEVIQNILKNREKKLIENAQKSYNELYKYSNDPKRNKSIGLIDNQRLKIMGEMIQSALFAVNMVIGSTDDQALLNWADLEEKILQ